MRNDAVQEMAVPATVRQVYDSLVVHHLRTSTPSVRSAWAASVCGLIRDLFHEPDMADAGTAHVGGESAVGRYSDLLGCATVLFAQGIELGDPDQVDDAVQIGAGLVCLASAAGDRSAPVEVVA